MEVSGWSLQAAVHPPSVWPQPGDGGDGVHGPRARHQRWVYGSRSSSRLTNTHTVTLARDKITSCSPVLIFYSTMTQWQKYSSTFWGTCTSSFCHFAVLLQRQNVTEYIYLSAVLRILHFTWKNIEKLLNSSLCFHCETFSPDARPLLRSAAVLKVNQTVETVRKLCLNPASYVTDEWPGRRALIGWWR